MNPSAIDGYFSSRVSRRRYQPFGRTRAAILWASQLIPAAMTNRTSARPTPAAANNHASNVPTSGVAPTCVTVLKISDDASRDATAHAQLRGGTTHGRDGKPKRVAPYVMTRHAIIKIAQALSSARAVIRMMA